MRRQIMIGLMAVLLLGAFLVGKELKKYVYSDWIQEAEAKEKKVIVLDSGHGGSDPGKVGIGDVLEKDLNLEIALKTQKQLEKAGYKVVMTRTADEGLKRNGKEAGKTEDMRARVEIMNREKPALVVSIHQNSYPQSNVKGAQVFYYSHSKEGEKAAVTIQKALKKLDENNTREAKDNDTYYLLRKTEVPAVIVECGFLTNPEEAKKLQEESYQKQVAELICEGVKDYLDHSASTTYN
ncbi:MAG: N-acetylmuramoyl-L-alanine amidase CwlD [Lachnospiraceae bacterium]|mgnify:CR=1 FL=1|nr:N-acetylmuramoyl-L-alanine amidase CwlD [Lachnospiraceae bacterium]